MDYPKSYFPGRGVLSIHITKTGSITTNIIGGVWIQIYRTDVIDFINHWCYGTESEVKAMIETLEYYNILTYVGVSSYNQVKNTEGKYVRPALETPALYGVSMLDNFERQFQTIITLRQGITEFVPDSKPVEAPTVETPVEAKPTPTPTTVGSKVSAASISERINEVKVNVESDVNATVLATRAKAIDEFIKFMKEFAIDPSIRLINRLSRAKTVDTFNRILYDYFNLMDSPDTQAVLMKMKSSEFATIRNNLMAIKPDKMINQRLVIFYGPQGTGKTTTAERLCQGIKKMCCSGSMLPDDLFRTFDFNDENGNPVFRDTPLAEAMKLGYNVILDEFNLLSIECLRSLQPILDNSKKVVLSTGEEIEIKDGFCVIGTMNLVVNGMTFGLPEPIVDRIAESLEFKLDSETLAKLAF